MSTYQELKGLKIKYLSSDTSGDRLKEGEVFYNSTDFKLKSFVSTAAWHSAGSLLSERGFFDKGLKFRSMFLPDKFLDQDTPENMYKYAGLDCDSIVQKIENVLNSNIVIAKNKNLS